MYTITLILFFIIIVFLYNWAKFLWKKTDKLFLEQILFEEKCALGTYPEDTNYKRCEICYGMNNFFIYDLKIPKSSIVWTPHYSSSDKSIVWHITNDYYKHVSY